MSAVLASKIYSAAEYIGVRERLCRPTVVPTVSESNAAGFFTVDIHIQRSLEGSVASDESGLAHKGAAELGILGKRDGLAHIFSAAEGLAVPSQLAVMKFTFWVLEVPVNFLGKVNWRILNFLHWY